MNPQLQDMSAWTYLIGVKDTIQLLFSLYGCDGGPSVVQSVSRAAVPSVSVSL